MSAIVVVRAERRDPFRRTVAMKAVYRDRPRKFRCGRRVGRRVVQPGAKPGRARSGLTFVQRRAYCADAETIDQRSATFEEDECGCGAGSASNFGDGTCTPDGRSRPADHLLLGGAGSLPCASRGGHRHRPVGQSYV